MNMGDKTLSLNSTPPVGARCTSPLRFALLGITLLAVALRVWHLNGQSLGYDEGYSIALARQSLGAIAAQTAADIQPPLYYDLLHFWMQLFGTSEAAVRSLSLLFGVLTVPLLYALGRRLFGPATGLLAALLGAVSPFWIWYAQEARNYTLVTFLGALSSYLLLAISLPCRAGEVTGCRTLWIRIGGVRQPVKAGVGVLPRQERRRAGVGVWIAFVLINIAAVYTHYYAFFLVAFQALFFLLVWAARYLPPLSKMGEGWGGGQLLAGLAAFAAIGLAYLPWIGYALNRLVADTSYWEGTLALGTIVRQTLLAFSTGHTVVESQAQWIAVGYVLLLVVGVVAALCRGAREQGSRGAEVQVRTQSSSLITRNFYLVTFAVLYLVVPILLLFAISYARPKFHPRYLMLASPAFFLFIAAGIALASRSTFDVSRFTFHVSRHTQHATRLTFDVLRFTFALCSILFVLATSVYSLSHYYTNTVYVRDDFRSVARYVLTHQTAEEAVILTSGHLRPVFDYYYPRGNVYPIPDIPILSTAHPLTYAVADDLNRIAAAHSGIWLVLWQDDAVDPAGVLTTLLDEQARPLPVEQSFWGIRLRHYALPSGVRFSSEPRPQHPASVNFGGDLALLGYSAAQEATPSGQSAELTLYWQALRPLSNDLRLALRLSDAQGHTWGRFDGRPAGYGFPTNRWPAGTPFPGRVTLPIAPGTPPGLYRLEASVYPAERPDQPLDVLDARGAPAGKSRVIGLLTMTGAAHPPAVGDLGLRQQLNATFGPVALVGATVEATAVQPGDRLLVTLGWQALAAPTADYTLRLALVDAQGLLASEARFPPAGDFYATSRWPAGDVLLGQYDFLVADVAPGEWQLQATLLDAPGQPLGAPVTIARLQVKAVERRTTVPPIQHPLRATLGDAVTLLGYDLTSDTVAPGGQVQLTLYWQATGRMDKSYTVFTHLLDANERIAAQQDSVPVGGRRPTTGWVSGEIIVDPYTLVVKPDAAPGDYVLEIGLYEAATGDRLPVRDAAGQPLGDRLLLGQVKVAK
jgi:mannosyltransferase